MRTVLIIDDEPDILEYLQGAFGEEKYVVIGAHTATQALAILSRIQVHVVLSDIMLPDMSGLKLVEHLRAQGNHIPAIFMTAYDDADFRTRAANVGATQFFLKPFRVSELDEEIKRMLIGI